MQCTHKTVQYGMRWRAGTRDADRRQQEKLQEGTVSVVTAFLFLSKCFLMALSMQDAFAASILPVDPDVY